MKEGKTGWQAQSARSWLARDSEVPSRGDLHRLTWNTCIKGILKSSWGPGMEAYTSNPSTWETERDRSHEVRSLRTAWPIWRNLFATRNTKIRQVKEKKKKERIHTNKLFTGRKHLQIMYLTKDWNFKYIFAKLNRAGQITQLKSQNT
ncbi:putative uncharacterized protein C8orf44 [Plecturocebus cupreus]